MNELASACSDSAQSKSVDPPHEFVCPICLELFTDPVLVETGHTYDRGCLVSWLSSGACTCPKTGRRLQSATMLPNVAVKNLVTDWCAANNVPLPKIKGNAKFAAPPSATVAFPWVAYSAASQPMSWWDYTAAVSQWQASWSSFWSPSMPSATADQTVPQVEPENAVASTGTTVSGIACSQPLGMPVTSTTSLYPYGLFMNHAPPAAVSEQDCSTASASLPGIPITGDKAEMSRAVLRVLSAINADINTAICIIQNLRTHSLEQLQPGLDSLRHACQQNNPQAAKLAAKQLGRNIQTVS